MTDRRVLIVDDASLVRLYYREALQRACYSVDEAMNGLEALEKLLVTPADLVLVDINMPKMDGLTFLKMLRSSDGEVAGIPAMVTSTEARVVDRDAARAAGANYYLVKPVRAETLVLHVDLLTGRRS
jgi:two-component system chemotaxis response regulator CheY